MRGCPRVLGRGDACVREKSWKVEEGGFLDEFLHFTFAKGQPWALCSEA